MNKSKLTISELLYLCSIRINNSINDQDILSVVSAYGYTKEKLSEGQKLVGEAEKLTLAFDKEYGEVNAAFDSRDAQREKANINYMRYLNISKVAFKNDAAAQVALQITGRRAPSISKWLTQTKSFYNNLLANTEWMQSMSTFGISSDMLNTGLNEILEVEKMTEQTMREKGDAQSITIKRDQKLDELYEWVSDYEDIAKVALDGNEQLLEKLGIIVKNNA